MNCVAGFLLSRLYSILSMEKSLEWIVHCIWKEQEKWYLRRDSLVSHWSLFRRWKWKRLYLIILDIPLRVHSTWVLLFTLTSWDISLDLEEIHFIQKELTVSRSGLYSIDKWRLEREYGITMILNEDGQYLPSLLLFYCCIQTMVSLDRLSSMVINWMSILQRVKLNQWWEKVEMEWWWDDWFVMIKERDIYQTWRMCVPHHSVGRIIGKKHANIIEVRIETNDLIR